VARKLRALLFEDDPILRELLILLIEGQGYEVRAYSEPLHCPVYSAGGTCDCPEGTACADVMVTDVEMPRVTGLQMLADQLGHGCRTDVRNVAVMSGGWTAQRLEVARDLGCKTFDKPFAMVAFNRWLAECAERARGELELRDLE
jgi:CheY-like chemotaxis protein